jgi:hypothetical protein
MRLPWQSRKKEMFKILGYLMNKGFDDLGDHQITGHQL